MVDVEPTLGIAIESSPISPDPNATSPTPSAVPNRSAGNLTKVRDDKEVRSGRQYGLVPDQLLSGDRGNEQFYKSRQSLVCFAAIPIGGDQKLEQEL
jgi:hypothetical protein